MRILLLRKVFLLTHTIVSTCQIAIPCINRAMAGLYKYFQRQSLPTSKETGLNEVATKEANASVEKVLEELQNGREKGESTSKKRKYTHFTPEQRAKIAKYAAESGNTAAVRHTSILMQLIQMKIHFKILTK